MFKKLKGKILKARTKKEVVAKKNLGKKKSGISISKISLAELMSKTFPPREFLLAPWLPLGAVVMVYASRGVGKTFFAHWVACAVATGGRYLKWEAPKPRKVLLLDGEMTGLELQERLEGIIASNGGRSEIPFDVITPDMQEDGMLDLSDPRHQKSLEPFLADVDLIIVDNIATLCRTGNENDTEGWRSTQNWALTQKARGKTVMFIHHAGKNGQERGASAREDVLHSVISLQRLPGYKPEDGAAFEVRFEKNRGFCGEAAKSFTASLVWNLPDKPYWEMGATAPSKKDKVMLEAQKLKEEGHSQEEIARRIGKSPSTISRYLNAVESNVCA